MQHQGMGQSSSRRGSKLDELFSGIAKISEIALSLPAGIKREGITNESSNILSKPTTKDVMLLKETHSKKPN